MTATTARPRLAVATRIVRCHTLRRIVYLAGVASIAVATQLVLH